MIGLVEGGGCSRRTLNLALLLATTAGATAAIARAAADPPPAPSPEGGRAPLPGPDELIEVFRDESVPINIDRSSLYIGEWQKPELCGVNAAYILLRICNTYLLYDDVREIAGKPPSGGFSLVDIVRLCERFGLRCEILRGDLTALIGLGPPAILLLGDPDDKKGSGHYVVFSTLTRGDQTRVTLVDGTTGITYTVNESDLWWLDRNWSGYLIRPKANLLQSALQWASILTACSVAVLCVEIGARKLLSTVDKMRLRSSNRSGGSPSPGP